MPYRDRLVIDPEVRGGRPTIRGTRIAVQDVLEYLGNGGSEVELLEDFPDLAHEDVTACLAFAADRERRLMTTVF